MSDAATARLPFACRRDDGTGDFAKLVKKQVTQCALSRICGYCGESLDRPVTFVGSPDEAGRLAFHVPALHAPCAERLLDDCADMPIPGQSEVAAEWVVLTTSGFDLQRPQSYDVDRRPTLSPNSVIGERRVPVASGEDE